MLGIPQFTGGTAGFMNPEASVGQSRLDTSPEHQANIYMKQMGFSQGDSGYRDDYNASGDPYGFGAEDWNDIKRFASNPMDPVFSKNYQGLVSSMRNNMGRVGGFNGAYANPGDYNEFQRFTNDLPMNIANGFNILPPSSLQNWIFGPGIPGQQG